MASIKEKITHWSYDRQRLGKHGNNLTQVLKDIIGVYSTHPSGPLSLYARVNSFKEDDFYNLDYKRLALRVPAMRLSVYMLNAETAHLAFNAVVPSPSSGYWEKRYSQPGRKIPKEHYNSFRNKILQLTSIPMSAAEIKEAAGIPDETIKPALNRMAYEGDLLRVGAKSLRSNIISYVSAKDWSKGKFVRTDENKALAWLAGEYLRAFGPARIKDFQWWAGVTSSKAKSAITACKTIEIENGLLLPASDLKKFESFKIPAKDSLDLLPQWDSYTMGYPANGRERFVEPGMQQYIYGKLGATGGNALGTVLVNGSAHGSWDFRFEGTKMKIKLNMFEKPSAKLMKNLTDRFNDMGALLKAKEISLTTDRS